LRPGRTDSTLLAVQFNGLYRIFCTLQRRRITDWLGAWVSPSDIPLTLQVRLEGKAVLLETTAASSNPTVASELKLPQVGVVASRLFDGADVESVRLTGHPRLFTLSFAPSKVVKSFSPPSGKSRVVSPRLPTAPTIKPPATASVIPLRERLSSALQPPISTLLGDTDVWLPFQPFGYQFEGIQFLYSRFSALLGDEMGLGKTMQTILAMRLLFRSGLISNALLVCPKPLTTNWMREFSMWADEIPVSVIQGETHARRRTWLHDRSPVKLVNYECLTRDEDLLREGKAVFDLVVLDEAQRIKNRESHTARVTHTIHRRRSWVLTGTPVENHARDLCSLLEFCNNGRKIVEESNANLRSEVSSVLLRRTKEQVGSDLPPKLITDTLVDLGPSQRERYESAERDGVRQLNLLEAAVTIEHVFELIRWLKNICNFDPVTGESAKADKLKADLEEIAASGKKAILFSQYVTTIDKLAETLSDFRPLVFHGKVPNAQRDGVIKAFRDDPDRSIILMSYGTGAVGLNLQFANYVFLYDRWWNPAVEDQAVNRAHRIGQKEPVFVSRFITPQTIEERVAQILARKRNLFAALIEGLEPAESVLTPEEVFGLFDLKITSRSSEAA
jgi:SNF2 family DNA or RNA helicase